MQKDKIFGAVPSISRIRVGDVHVAGLDGVCVGSSSVMCIPEMSNYLETTKELTAYLSAVTPLIVVHTEERGRAQGALTEAARELNVDSPL